MTVPPYPNQVQRYRWSETGRGATPQPAERVIGAWMYQESEGRSPRHKLHSSPAPVWSEDLLRIARAVFVADRDAKRNRGADRWTRDLSLSVPVEEPALWRGRPTQLLTALLGTLTGDRWDVTLRAPDQWLTVPQVLPAEQGEVPPEVALFSGGLDSLSWAARRASQQPETRLVLISFGENSARDAQSLAWEEVSALARRAGRQVVLREYSQDVNWPGEGRVRGESESSTRTRGFLYVATAIRTAAAEHAELVHTPENGQIALNPPLTAARSAACSTRSVHPQSLYLLNALIGEVEGQVRVVNPLELETKGEVCGAALQAGLSSETLGVTVSCGRRFFGSGRSCGRCWPCLVRRSGLRYAGHGDSTPYEHLPWWGSKGVYPDWVDLVRWLRRDFGMSDLLADTPLPPGADRAAVLDVITRGRAELRDWVRSMA